MSWLKGFNFRATSGFVTDGTNETYVSGPSPVETYPVTRNGVTFGWEATASLTGNDRDALAERRFAGTHYTQPGTTGVFRVDLDSAGSCDVALAWGGDTDQDLTPYRQDLEIFDNASSLVAYNNQTGRTQDNYFDATGVNRTEAAWPGSNAAYTAVFASTILKIKIGHTSGSYSQLDHMFLTISGAAVGVNRSLQCETGVFRSFA